MMRTRRLVFLLLVLTTMAGLTTWLAMVFAPRGLTVAELLLITLFALNTPWLAIGLWNAVIGVAVMHLGSDWLYRVLPISGLNRDGTCVDDGPLTPRTAVAMPVRNENPDTVFARLRAVAASLEATGHADDFELFLLSDSSRSDIAAEEERLCAGWRSRMPLHYHRRPVNHRYKVGNIEEFCDRAGDGFDHMVLLDADSLMSGAAIVRLVRLMQANPNLGILQTLVTGLPSLSPFCRVFQFGMRHGMRAYTAGKRVVAG